MRYVVLPNKSIFSINQKTLVQTQGYFKPQFKFLIFVFLFKAEAIYEYIPKIQSEIYHQLLHKQTHESSEDPKLTCMVYPNNHKILFTIAILGFEGRQRHYSNFNLYQKINKQIKKTFMRGCSGISHTCYQIFSTQILCKIIVEHCSAHTNSLLTRLYVPKDNHKHYRYLIHSFSQQFKSRAKDSSVLIPNQSIEEESIMQFIHAFHHFYETIVFYHHSSS